MKTIVLLSGGIDSTTLLHDRLATGDQVMCLSFYYGQRHMREIDAAITIANRARVRSLISQIRHFGLPQLKGSSQTDSAIAVPEGHYTDESMKATVVPNRNMIMLSIAVAAAISEGYDQIAFAAHAGDHAIYPDCRPEFVTSFGKTILLANAWTPIQVLAPFINMSKAQIVQHGHVLKVPFELTYSCYKGLPKHCGVCGTCVERREAFANAAVEDPTKYMERFF